MPTRDELTELLRRLDEEEPRDYAAVFDHKRALLRFDEVRRALEAELGTELPFETGAQIQDAAFHSYVGLPPLSGPAALRFSNFGDLVSMWGDDEAAPAELLARVIPILERHGYVYVPFALLQRPSSEADAGVPDLWSRFFDYL